MITINKIISEVGRVLCGQFGDECTYYAEEVKQGLKEPCFFISCISPKDRLLIGNFNSHVLGKRYYRQNRLCIQYFPESQTRGREESYDVAEQMCLCLEMLDCDGDLLRGTDMGYEFVDGVMSFFINYNYFVYVTREPTFMGEIRNNVNIALADTVGAKTSER